MSRRQLFEFALVTLIWGCTWTVIRGQIVDVPAAWSVAYRFLLAGAAMVAYCVATDKTLALGTRGLGLALVIALFQFVLNFNLVYAAERTVTSGLVAVVFALLVVPNAALARIFLGQRLTPAFLLGSALGIAGVGLMFRQEFTGPALGEAATTGLLLTVGAVLAASAANVIQAGGLARRQPLHGLVAVALVLGGLLDTAVAYMLDGPPRFDTSFAYIGGLLFLALAATALAFVLYYDLIRAFGPARAAYSSLIVPFVAMALSTVFESYRWTPYAIAGGALAAVGMVLALRSRRA